MPFRTSQWSQNFGAFLSAPLVRAEPPQVETLVGTMAQIVKLRNPWGQTEWAGLYSDGSCAWTDDAEAQVSVKSKQGLSRFYQQSEKLEKAGTVDFKKKPRTEGGDKVPVVSTQGSRQVCLSRCPKS